MTSKFLAISISALLFFGTIGCTKKTSRDSGKVVFAQIDDVHLNKRYTLPWLKLEDKYTFGIPLEKVHLYVADGIKTSSPLVTIYFNQRANVNQADIEMPTLEDLKLWQEAFDKNEPVILYPKSP